MKKILSIILMLTLALVLFSCTKQKCYTCVDNSGDGKCDVCGSTMESCKHYDKNSDNVCDACKADLPLDPCEECVDEDGDGSCDVCGEYVESEIEPCDECIDEDDDGVCDVCGEPVEPEEPEEPGDEPCTKHVDSDKNGKCDKCGKNVAIEPTEDPCTKHVDVNKDDKCDKCGKAVDIKPCDEHMDRSPKDSVCDICGETVKTEDPSDKPTETECSNHVDKNTDGKCDRCGASVDVDQSCSCNDPADVDADGKCDICDKDVNLSCTNHTDSNKDGKCDECGQSVSSSVSDPIKMILDMYNALAPTKVETQTMTAWGKYVIIDNSTLRVGKIDGDDVAVYEFTKTTFNDIESGADVLITPPYSTESHKWEYHSTLGRREDGGKWDKVGDDFTPSVGANALNITSKNVSAIIHNEAERTVTFTVLKKNTSSVFGESINANVEVVISYSDADITEVNIYYEIMGDDDVPEVAVSINAKYYYDIQQITIN